MVGFQTPQTILSESCKPYTERQKAMTVLCQRENTWETEAVTKVSLQEQDIFKMKISKRSWKADDAVMQRIGPSYLVEKTGSWTPYYVIVLTLRVWENTTTRHPGLEESFSPTVMCIVANLCKKMT